MAYEVLRFPYDGTIDADGHVLEPAWLWEEYLEERYATARMRIRVDDAGFEYLELDGGRRSARRNGVARPARRDGRSDARPGTRPSLHGPHAVRRRRRRPSASSCSSARTSRRACSIRRSACCGSARSTTRSSSLAYLRAYNRWIADFCRDSGGRLVPIAHLTLLDPEGAAAELERAVKDGCSGGFVAPFTHTRKAHGHPDHDVLFAKAVRARRAARASIRPSSRSGRRRSASSGLGRAGRVLLQRHAAPGRAAGVPLVLRARHARSLPDAAARRARRRARAGSAPSSIAWTRSTRRSRRAGWR